MLNEEIFIMEKINDFNEAKNLLEKYRITLRITSREVIF